MKIILILITFFVSSIVNAQTFSRDWEFQRNTTLADIYHIGASIGNTVSLSFPNGQQAIVTYVNTPGVRGSLLYRCIEYFDENMQLTGNNCYLLKHD